MPHRAVRRVTLTNRLLALAALIVVVTTLLLVATTAAGVYGMASRQASVTQSTYLEMLLVDLGAQLEDAARVVRAAAAEPELTGGGADLDAILGRFATENAEWVQEITLLDHAGGVLAAYPVNGPTTPGMSDALTRWTGEALSFHWAAPVEPAGAGDLWAMVPVRMPEGSARSLAVVVRTARLESVLDHVASTSESARALVLGGGGEVVFGDHDIRLGSDASVSFVPDEAGSLAGGLTIEGGRDYLGRYADLAEPPGPAWRLAVVEPAERAWQQTREALRPGLLGWVAALGVALVAALAVVRRVTKPLRQLEERARALASGASVEPAAVVAHDEVGRLLEAFNSIAQRVDHLGDIAELLARASDTSLVLQGVTSSTAHMLGAVDVDVLLLTEAGELELVAAEGALEGSVGITVPVARVPWVANTLATGDPVMVVPMADDDLVSLHERGEAAALAAPLSAGGQTIGVVVVVRPGQDRFTDAESETVRSFAAQASVALQNSRLFEEERQSRREAEALRAIAERLASPLALEDTLAELGRTAADLLGADRSFVVVDNRADFGLPPGAAETDEAWIRAWESAVSAGASAGASALFDLDGPSEPAARLLFAQGARAALVVPILLDDVRVGLLVLVSVHATSRFGEHRRMLADTLGTQAALALRNAALYEQARNRADNLETIFRISQAVASSLQSRIVLNRVLDVVQKILSADAVMLMTYDPQRKVMTVPMARGILHRYMLEATFRPGEDVPGRVFETREPERFDRLAGADTPLLAAAADQGLQSLLAVPLLARGRSIGVLAAFAMTESAFSTEELDLLRTFASQAALAIDTAEMFSREHHVASVLQQSILPTRLERLEGIEASSVYLPAVGDAEIGGDYYDLFTAPDGRVVISIGDVCGKGVEAATKTSMLKYSIRGMVVAGLEPAVILRALNEMLLELGDPAGIVTLWIGFLETSTGVLSYANGGHPPALVLDPVTGRILRLPTTGALLGAVSGADWAQESVTMRVGDTLLLYTDGVTEARSGARFFGEGRVRRALRGGGSAADVVQRLLALLQRFAAGDLRDDAAVLAVVRSG